MRLNAGWIFIAILAILIIATLLFLPRRAHAAPLQYSGAVELRSPIMLNAPGVSGWNPEARFLDLAGYAKLSAANSPLALWVSGEQSLSRQYYGVHESKMKLGIDWKLKSELPVTLFSYWERRFDTDLDRVFVGVRLGFHGNLN